jgi:zinc transport system substrate-binding protein
LYAAVSSDEKYVAFALDDENGILVIPVNSPASSYKILDVAGSSATNHSTVVFDGNDLLYYADMVEAGEAPQNLMVFNLKTGTKTLSGGYAGNAPHGGVYSPVTKKVYFNCADGISVVGPGGYEKKIPYTHEGDRLSQSWISENGSWMISYASDEANNLAYTSVVAYDLVNEALVAEIDVDVPKKAAHGWPTSILLEDGRTIAIADPATGRVLLADIVSGMKTTIDLEVQEPVSMGLVEDGNRNNLWVVTGEGMMYLVDVEAGRVELNMEMESTLGNNLGLSIASTIVEQDTGKPQYDPHTWISPFNARQQAKMIYGALVAEDPDNAEYYTERWEELDQKLADLDVRYKTELAEKSFDMIFVSHSAYGYLADRYGFTQKGVIGIYADEQPSVASLKNLVKDMVDHGIYVVYYDPTWTDKYTNTLKSSVESLSGHSVQVLKLYLLVGNVDGLDYLGQMEANLETLKIGLGASG